MLASISIYLKENINHLIELGQLNVTTSDILGTLAITMVFLAYCYIHSVISERKLSKARSWKYVMGSICDIEITGNMAKLSYRYQFNDARYLGEAINLKGGYVPLRLLRSIPEISSTLNNRGYHNLKDKMIRIYVDPESQHHSTILTGISIIPEIMIIPCITAISIVLVFFYRLIA
jgi:hypothetical protein